MKKFAKIKYDPAEMYALLEQEGYDDVSRFEWECGIRRGRLDQLEENGWDPYYWEVQRMALVLDMSMDDLGATIFSVVSEQG